ncbi:MAG TPA: endonuclease/exonuclease/phosphatase family protein [Acetobacteraceae bacterium]|nr:endonuclease/exonuclease/phosphatase family protein [Acetobacteraceae bacterium]
MREGSARTEFQRSLDISRIYRKAPQTAMPRTEMGHMLRILSWNIGRGYDPERIADTLGVLRPDVVCLQEVDWNNVRTGSRDVLQILADRTNMLGLFSTEFVELPSPGRTRRLAGGGVTGNALLCRVGPTACFRIELPSALDWEHDADNMKVPARVRGWLRRERRIGRRFGLAAEFEIGGAKVVTVSVHLEDKFGGVTNRFHQYQAVLAAIDACGRNAAATSIVAGDFNTFDSRLARFRSGDTDATALGRPAGVAEAAWWKRALLPATGFADPFELDAWTFRIPLVFRAKLDWILLKNGGVRDCGIGSFSSSDHRPIWADIEVANAS